MHTKALSQSSVYLTDELDAERAERLEQKRSWKVYLAIRADLKIYLGTSHWVHKYLEMAGWAEWWRLGETSSGQVGNAW